MVDFGRMLRIQGSFFKVPTNNLRDFPDRVDFRWLGAGSFPEQRLVIEPTFRDRI